MARLAHAPVSFTRQRAYAHAAGLQASLNILSVFVDAHDAHVT
jgi:hypothetical protein